VANYVKATNFAVKDSLGTSDPAKIIKGTEIDNEYNAVASAVSSKADSNSPTLTGTPLAPTAAPGTNTTQIATTAFVTAAAGNATNIAGGAANRVVYQTALDTTGFAVAPTVAGTYLGWTGSAFAWSTVSASTSAALTMNNSGSGDSSGATFNGSIAKTISYNTIGAPSVTGTGASGTWGINITGSSGSTSFATNAGGLTGTPAITVGAVTAAGLSATSITTTGTVLVGTSGSGAYSAFAGSSVQLANNTTSMSNNGSTFTWAQNGTNILAVSPAQLVPLPDNTLSLGSGTLRWTTVYATTGTINTSDQNDKQQITDLTTAEKAVGQALKGMMKTFKFNDAVTAKGSAARVHFGTIAQDVKAAFEAQGLDANKYGVFCSDTLPNGDVRLGVRYEELFALIIGSL
jgi:hypothetical protein